MSGFVRYKGTITPSDTAPTDALKAQPYTAFKIATDGAVALYDKQGVAVPASDYLGGMWHYVEFSGILDSDTAATSVQVGVLVNSGITAGQ